MVISAPMGNKSSPEGSSIDISGPTGSKFISWKSASELGSGKKSNTEMASKKIKKESDHKKSVAFPKTCGTKPESPTPANRKINLVPY
jgi:hypothetical protein